MKETEAIFTIVFRNLALANWTKLLPEAQVQMLDEVAGLMRCEALAFDNKRQLGWRLDLLQNYVTQVERERIREIMGLLEQPAVAELNYA
ncbi:MAG: hypothetical protein WA919_09785 [Coleofasciculaceae cyanobacterium]